MKVAHLAEAFKLPVTSHGAHDATVHGLAACANASYLELHGFSLDAVVEEPLRLVDGRLAAPDQPAHDIAFRRDEPIGTPVHQPLHTDRRRPPRRARAARRPREDRKAHRRLRGRRAIGGPVQRLGALAA